MPQTTCDPRASVKVVVKEIEDNKSQSYYKSCFSVNYAPVDTSPLVSLEGFLPSCPLRICRLASHRFILMAPASANAGSTTSVQVGEQQKFRIIENYSPRLTP